MPNPASWSLARRTLGPAGFLVAGVLNVTPDSFYDGGRHASHQAAAAYGLNMLEQGADILDVGGESTRPGAEAVPAQEEMNRVLPVIQALSRSLREQDAQAAVSVDTYKPATAAAALEAGAEIVNDVSACRFDPELADVLAQHKPGYVLMHALGRPQTMQDDPVYDDVIADILRFFEERLAMLAKAGLPEDRVVLDPGIGFGKTLDHNLEILRRLDRFLVLGRPLFVGLSRKSLWRKLLGLSPSKSLIPTCAACALLLERGAFVHRVHDPAAVRQALAAALAMTPGSPATQAA